MSATIDTLPDDPAQLKALLADNRKAYEKEKQAFEAEVKHLREQLNVSVKASTPSGGL